MKSNFPFALFILLAPSFCLSAVDKSCFDTYAYSTVVKEFGLANVECDRSPAFKALDSKIQVASNYYSAFLDPGMIENKTTRFDAYLNSGEKTSCTAAHQKSNYSLSGWYLFILEGLYVNPMGRVSTFSGDGKIGDINPETLFPLERAQGLRIKELFETGGGGTLNNPIQTIQIPVTPRYIARIGDRYVGLSSKTTSNNEAVVFSSGNIISKMSSALSSNGWEQFTVGFVQRNGRWVPAVVIQFGNEQHVYAPYGEFTRQEEAGLYGFEVGEKLYYSTAREVGEAGAPGAEVSWKTQFFEVSQRYGSTIYSQNDLETNLAAIKDDIPWQTECRHSGMEYHGDPATNEPKITAPNGKKASNKGTPNCCITPLAPDNVDNTNPVTEVSCPDQTFYYSLYKKCIEKIYGPDDYTPDQNDWTNIEDYYKSKMASEPSWTYKDPDGNASSFGVAENEVGETPAYYNKRGERINPGAETEIYNPYDSRVTFGSMSQHVKWDDYFLGWSYVSNTEQDKIDLTSRVKPVLNVIKDFYLDYAVNGIDGIMAFFQINPDEHTESLTFKKTVKKVKFDLEISSGKYFHHKWQFLNRNDKSLPFKSPTDFVINDNSGTPLRLGCPAPTRDALEYFVTENIDDNRECSMEFEYSIFATSGMYGDPVEIGKLRIHKMIWDNKRERNIAGEYYQGRVLTYGPPDALISTASGYDLNSRTGRTDQQDLSDRDDLTFEQKRDAFMNIALHIAVSEGVDFMVKFIYENYKYVYPAVKKAENYAAVAYTVKMAIALYHAYKEWALMMDLIADVRDTYHEFHKSTNRLKRSSQLMVDHFVNLDYSKIRPTNITMIYPKRAIRYFDYATWNAEGAVKRFEYSSHALAFNIDRFTHGPGKVVISSIHNTLFQSMAKVRVENEAKRKLAQEDLSSTMNSAERGDSPSDMLKLSKYTKIIIDKTNALHAGSVQSATEGILTVLTGIQDESRDWVTMKSYVTENIAGGPGAFMQSKRDRTPEAIYNQFNVGTVFENKWVNEKLKETEPENPGRL